MSHSSRSPLIDMVKGLACLAIVLHHLAFYGPMSDVVHRLAPGPIDWLYEYGRMAVQVFLVLGGYLAAASLAPRGVARFEHVGQVISRRFARLVGPYGAALLLSILAAALVRPWMDHPSVPDEPELLQLLANAFLLQDIVGQDALSAGVWYVAIDFQLFALSALLLAGVRAAPGTRRTLQIFQLKDGGYLAYALVAVLTALSLLFFNRQAELDMWALYFFGAYGLGMMAFWAVRSPRVVAWFIGIAALGLLSLAIDFRVRIAVALAAALCLVVAMRTPALRRWRGAGWLQGLGQRSFSVFLVHFPVCLLVNAFFSRLWPESPLMNALGMAVALMLSLLAGRVLYTLVESKVPSWTMALRWQAGMVGTGLLIGFTSR